jgi:hypothetical protein
MNKSKKRSNQLLIERNILFRISLIDVMDIFIYYYMAFGDLL